LFAQSCFLCDYIHILFLLCVSLVLARARALSLPLILSLSRSCSLFLRTQYEQRCHEVWHLVDVQLRLASDKHDTPNLKEHMEPPHRAAVTDDTAGSLQQHVLDWIAGAAEQLHEKSLLRIQEALQQELKSVDVERKEELHFLEQLQELRGKPDGTKNALDYGFEQFCLDEMCAIARRRAVCLQVCCAVKLFLNQYLVRDTEIDVDMLDTTLDKVHSARTRLLVLAEKAMLDLRGAMKPEADNVSTLGGGSGKGEGGKSGILGAMTSPWHPQQASRRSTTSLVVHTAVSSRYAAGAIKGSGGVSHGRVGPVFVSGDVKSASEACVEYLQGVKRRLDRSTHVLMSGDVLRDVDLMSVEEIKRAMDADVAACDLLVRVVMAGLGLQQKCDVFGTMSSSHQKQKTVLQIPLAAAHRGIDIEKAVDYCKSVCRTVDLVLENKVANAVVLLGPMYDLKTTRNDLKPSHGVDKMCVVTENENILADEQGGGRRGAESEVKEEGTKSDLCVDGEGERYCGTQAIKDRTQKAASIWMKVGGVGGADGSRGEASDKRAARANQIPDSETELLLTCVRAYVEARHPWLRRVAVVNLAAHKTVSGLSYTEDFLVLHPCIATSPKVGFHGDDAHDGKPLIDVRVTGVDATHQTKDLEIRAVAEGNPLQSAAANAFQRPQHSEVVPMVEDEATKNAKDKEEVSDKQSETEASGEGGASALNEKEETHRNQINDSEMQHVELAILSHTHALKCDGSMGVRANAVINSIGSGEGSSSKPVGSNANSESVTTADDTVDKAGAGVMEAEITEALKAFCPNFIFVVYDKGSRHRVAGNVGVGNSHTLEQESWQTLCSLSGSIVRDAEMLCNGNVIFLEAADTAPPASSTPAREWLAHVRTSGSVVEGVLGGGSPHGSDAGCIESGGEKGGSGSSFFPWPMPFRGTFSECKQVAGLHDKTAAHVKFDRQEIKFETLDGRYKYSLVSLLLELLYE